MNKVALITSGYFPVPAALGGAVEALDENIINQNEIDGRIFLTVFSCYNSLAEKKALEYKNTKVEFIKIPLLVKCCDKIIYFIAKNILKKKKSLSYRYIVQRLFYIQKVAKILRDNNFDRIVIENHSSLFMILKKYSNYKKYKNKYYYHLHNVVTNDYGCRHIIANCKKVLGVSNYINNTLKDFLGNDDKNNYVVLRNKVNRRRFLINLEKNIEIKLRSEYSIFEDDIVILFTGRFSPEKGVKELLQAFSTIPHEKAKLLIVGGYYYASGMMSPYEEEVKRLADSMKDRVVFSGYVEYDEIPQLYAIADIVVVPSIWDDPAPLTVIESLTSGKALITTYSGGIAEYADPDSSIILERDVALIDNLAKAIDMLIKSPEKRFAMEEAVKSKTRDWTISSFYHEFCDEIEE